MGGVEYHHLRVVAHDPDVVVESQLPPSSLNVPCVTTRWIGPPFT
jgi:hypothetical protein